MMIFIHLGSDTLHQRSAHFHPHLLDLKPLVSASLPASDPPPSAIHSVGLIHLHPRLQQAVAVRQQLVRIAKAPVPVPVPVPGDSICFADLAQSTIPTHPTADRHPARRIPAVARVSALRLSHQTAAGNHGVYRRSQQRGTARCLTDWDFHPPIRVCSHRRRRRWWNDRLFWGRVRPSLAG